MSDLNVEKMFINKEEKPLENIVNDGGFTSIFRTIGVVGDSLSSGEFEAVHENGEKSYHDYFEYSWGQFLGRSCGSTVYNFSRGGMTASEYCISFADSMRFWDSKYACQAYIIALGVNDILNCKQEIGSISDIDFDNYNNNKPTFAGYYSKIIQRLKKIQPRAKFFIMTMPDQDDCDKELVEKHRDMLYKISESFDNTYVLDFYKYAPKYNKDFKERFFLNGHLNPMGYKLTALMVGSYIDYIIRHNTNDFAEVGFIGTELKGYLDSKF